MLNFRPGLSGTAVERNVERRLEYIMILPAVLLLHGLEALYRLA